MKFIPVLAVLTAVSGCANRPESIHADFVSYERFSGLSCPTLADRRADTAGKLAEASRAQDNSANNDAFTVFLVGVPISKLAGDHEAEVARLKGEAEAIETAQIKARCRPA